MVCRRAPSQPRCRRCQGERGASMVEFALILPLFFSLALGILTGGISYNRKIQLTHAAREASRYAATLPVTTTMDSWLQQVATVSRTAAGGDLSPAPGRYVCVAYVHPAGTTPNDSTTRRVEDGLTAITTPNGVCFADGLAATDRRVQIQLERDGKLQAFFFTTTPRLKATSLSRFEQ